MARLKPSGIRLSVWRALHAEQRAAALQCEDLEAQRAVLQRFTSEHSERSSAAGTMARYTVPQTPRPKMAGSRRNTMTGDLDGWVCERRCTANGRKYDVFFNPEGQQFVSRAAALRSIGLGP